MMKYFICIVIGMFLATLIIDFSPLELDLYDAGVLRNPDSEEVDWLLDNSDVDKNRYVLGSYVCYNYALDMINFSEYYGIRCYMVILYSRNVSHAVIGYHTLDKGILFVEPQDDLIIDINDYFL